LVIVLSILVVRERWRRPHESQPSTGSGASDVGSTFLHRFRRWYHGE